MARRATALKVKANAAAFPVPQNRGQAVAAIAAIGRHQRERARIEAAMNDEIAAIKQRWEEEARPHAEAILALRQGVQIWCEANRDALTGGGKVKSVRLPSGEVRWRVTPPAVKLRAVDMVLQLLRERGLGRFIRIKEEVNREAILADPEAVAGIAGIRIEQREEFVILPFETKLEEVS